MSASERKVPRVLALMIDQVSGRWVNGVKLKATGFPPPNIKDYHRLGFIPNISHCIQNGLYARHAWNRAVCKTAYASRYAVFGTYSSERGLHIISAVKSKFSDLKAASFSNWDWDVFDPRHNVGPSNFNFNYTRYRWILEKIGIEYSRETSPSSEYWLERRRREVTKWRERRTQFDDHNLLHKYVIPWMKENRDWGIIYMHWVDHDSTLCPAFIETPKNPFDDKHHHLTDYVDRNVGELIKFLKSEGFWQEMYLIIFSDHGYHVNCDNPEAQKYGQDFCSNHLPPHDCFVWDYHNNRKTRIHSDCCRQILTVITGGALTPKLRGQQVLESEIIDIPSTIAHIYDIDYCSDGKSIFAMQSL